MLKSAALVYKIKPSNKILKQLKVAKYILLKDDKS